MPSLTVGDFRHLFRIHHAQKLRTVEPLPFYTLAHKNILIAAVSAAALPDLLLLFSLHQPVFYDSPWLL